MLTLMRQGLSEETIMDMPVTVFRLYSAAARRHEARQRHNEITGVISAIGHAFGGKETKAILSDLEYEMEKD